MWAIANDDPTKLREYADVEGIEIPFLLDMDAEIIRRYGVLNEASERVIAHPTAVIVDKAGVVRFVRVDENYRERPPLEELVEALAAPALAEALLADNHAARLVGMEAYDEARLWAGVPRFAVDYTQDHLPAEAALYDHISFNKGCYVGQEIHARMHYRGHPNRKLACVDFPAAEAERLAVGDELFLEGKAVGSLTSLSRLERGGLRRGIAMLRYQDLQQWPSLAAGADGAARAATRPLASDLGVAAP